MLSSSSRQQKYIQIQQFYIQDQFSFHNLHSFHSLLMFLVITSCRRHMEGVVYTSITFSLLVPHTLVCLPNLINLYLVIVGVNVHYYNQLQISYMSKQLVYHKLCNIPITGSFFPVSRLGIILCGTIMRIKVLQ